LNYRDQIRFQKNKTRCGNAPWTAGFISPNRRDSLAKYTGEAVSSNSGRWIQNGWIGLSREQSTAVLRPEQGRDGEFRGGAIAGDGYLAIQSTISRKKYTSG
jgi:hypothetical protein